MKSGATGTTPCDAERVLRRQRGDRGGREAAQRGHRLDVGLDAGAAARIGARRDQHPALHARFIPFPPAALRNGRFGWNGHCAARNAALRRRGVWRREPIRPSRPPIRTARLRSATRLDAISPWTPTLRAPVRRPLDPVHREEVRARRNRRAAPFRFEARAGPRPRPARFPRWWRWSTPTTGPRSGWPRRSA